jgi:asparagine synthase (glutamine-hydrolysing)
MRLSPPHGAQLDVRLFDSSRERTDTGTADEGGLFVAFMGHLDDGPGLAEVLGLGPGTPAAMLVLSAIRRWDDGAFAQLRGEWTLLCFNREKRVLWLAASETLRDQLYFACRDGRVAVAPQAALLSRLPWTGREFDPIGMICSMGKWPFRKQREGRTFLRNVASVECGTAYRIDACGYRRMQYATPPAFEPWHGSFDEAIAALEHETRQSVRRHLHRHETVAVMLSGGLDSSLMALLATEERRPGQRLFALSSVAPAGSGLGDEREFMKIVGDALDLPVVYISPQSGSEAYRPASRVFAAVEEPVVGQRHYLYDAFYAAASREGAAALLDGVFGELALTRIARQATLTGAFLALRGDARRLLTDTVRPPVWPHHGMLVTLSSRANEVLAGAFGTRPILLPKVHPQMRPGAPLGLPATYFKSGKALTSTWYPDVRQLYPYRDRKLLQLAARFPSRFTEAIGLPRSLARAILKDRLPDRIVMRSSKDVFSPDFHHRLTTQAAAARERLDLHRDNGAAEWLDLDWADVELTALSNGGILRNEEWSRLQSTVIAAEFFTWWADQSRVSPDRQT